MKIFKISAFAFLVIIFCSRDILAFPLGFPSLADEQKRSENKQEKEESKKTTSKHLIPLEIKKNDKNDDDSSTVFAKLRNVTDEGKKEGIDKMTLEGKIVDTKKNKSNSILTIIWQKATFNNKKAELDIPLQSKIGVKDQMEDGDSLSAKGDSAELLKAWKKIQNKSGNSSQDTNNSLRDGKEVSDKEKNDSNFISSNGRSDSGYLSSAGISPTSGTQSDIGAITTDYSSEEIITTAEGCNIRIDLGSGSAIVQERQLQGDKEISSCADSTTSYAIDKNYKQCIDYVDYSEGKAFKQYTLSYSNPTAGGNIQVQDCTIDRDQSAQIIDDYEKCSIQHNFKEGISTAQKRTIYIDQNGSEILLRGCHDSDKKYLHQETDDGCQDQVRDGIVVWSTKKFITVDGKKVDITACTPKEDGITIHEEVCTSNPYTHDFKANQSFINKNYFYYKDNQKMLLQDCVKSEEVMEHKQEIGVCQSVNDDIKKVSTPNFKTYIEDKGNKVFITDCIASNSPIPYTKVKARWVKQGTQTGKFPILTPNLTRLGYTDLGGNHNVSYDTSVDICYDHSQPDIWTLQSDGSDINEANSDQFVQYIFKFENYGIKYGFMYRLVCLDPHCTALTDLKRFPVYNRFDGSEYVDQSQILDRMKICGFGHLIDGQEGGI
jgi:hypothetical protein